MPIKNKKFDVVVAGGGTAGWAAALASARLGMKTAIIERKGYPGGVLASGLHILGFHDGTGRQVVKGYAHELVERMVGIGASDGYHKTDFWHSSFVAIDSFAIKHVIIDMLKEAGIKMLLFSQAVDVLLEGNKVRGIIVQTKTGRETIQCRVCVDATGDAAIAYAAGAEMQITGDVQPPSLVLRIENVDIGKLREYLLRNPEEFMTYRLKPGCKVTPQFLADTPFFMLSEKKLEKTEYTGEYMPFIDRFMFSLIPGARGVIVNMLRAYNIDGNDSESLSEAVVNCYRNAPFLLNAFKKNFPGFENS